MSVLRFVAVSGLVLALSLGSVAAVQAISQPDTAPPVSPLEQPLPPPAEGEPAPCVAMNNARLGELLRQLDPELGGGPGNWVIRFQDTPAQVVTDERADRMRIMMPVADATALDREALYRMMQANFESALDARYAIANGLVWVAFIHPLSPLTPGQLSLALAQTYNAAFTYGGAYSGGLFQFGGGDHRNEVFDDIIERGTPL